MFHDKVFTRPEVAHTYIVNCGVADFQSIFTNCTSIFSEQEKFSSHDWTGFHRSPGITVNEYFLDGNDMDEDNPD